MQSLAGLAAKLAVIAAAGAGLYVAYQYTDVKGVSNWTTSADRQRACAGEFLPAAPDGRAGLLWESDLAQDFS